VRLAARGAVALAAALLVFAPLIGAGRPAAGVLRLTVADVGQGDGMLLQFPTGHALAIDAGPATGGADTGERILAPVFWASGVRRLDWLTFTHADLDHIGGAASLVDVFTPREVWEGTPVPSDPKRSVLAEHVNRERAGWRPLLRGDQLTLGDVRVDVLNPPPADWERQRVRNDDSVVLSVRYGQVQLLLTGDIGEEAERGLALDTEPPARIRILKVAHHGSRTSSSAGFLARYAPDIAVVSAGRRNLFGHPAPEVIARLEAARAAVFRTDRDGAVIIETDGRGAIVRTMSGRTWRVEIWPRAPA
jgi:competence protein ComEC